MSMNNDLDAARERLQDEAAERVGEAILTDLGQHGVLLNHAARKQVAAAAMRALDLEVAEGHLLTAQQRQVTATDIYEQPAAPDHGITIAGHLTRVLDVRVLREGLHTAGIACERVDVAGEGRRWRTAWQVQPDEQALQEAGL